MEQTQQKSLFTKKQGLSKLKKRYRHREAARKERPWQREKLKYRPDAVGIATKKRHEKGRAKNKRAKASRKRNR